MKTLRFSILLSALLMVALAATTAVAQQPNRQMADALVRQAEAAEDQASNSEGANSKWEAARLHLESVKYRAADDPQAVTSIRTAALYLAYDRPDRAAELLIEAAERALTIGDPTTAAESYMDAASTLLGGRYRQVSESDFVKAKNWMNQAATIVTADEVSDAARTRILNRVGIDARQLAG